MCLIAFAWKQDPDYKLILIGNRDEFYHRKADTAQFWQEDKNILAGKDLTAGGTWLGVNRQGKMAAITNYRDLKTIKSNAPSRGKLTIDFLQNGKSGKEYLDQIMPIAANYNGFNLLIYDGEELLYFSNITGKYQHLLPGIYGLSNHMLNSSWPKVEKAKDALRKYLWYKTDLFTAFADTTLANDAILPDTGVGLELERKLSAMFIHFENYGTRCTSLIKIDNNNKVEFKERTFKEGKIAGTDALYQFEVLN
jgi:uncharacterized protein with NRDE domain